MNTKRTETPDENRPPCCRCGKASDFSVSWLAPSREQDDRPCCSARCANAEQGEKLQAKLAALRAR